MKMLRAIAFGILASFVLAYLGSLVVAGLMLRHVPIHFAAFLAFWPLIVLAVGAFVGGISEPDHARFAAALSLVPGALWLLIMLNRGDQTWSSRAITIAGAVVCIALCIASASVTSAWRSKAR